eukprot:COSAG06_NODE_8581_length_2124_cov_1.919506_4_plen_65_part_00
MQDSWSSIEAVVNVLGAGQPHCVPGPLPPNCTGERTKRPFSQPLLMKHVELPRQARDERKENVL